MGVYYAVPAFIYTLYNSLFFLNLRFFDPVSYRVLINMRVLFSGVLFQIIFSRQLGLLKWIALVLLMVACAVNQLDENLHLEVRPIYILAISFQAFTSSFGGVYSEFLLKKNLDISLNVKNMWLYAFSAIFNFMFIVIFRPHLLSISTFFSGYDFSVKLLILVGAFCGFSTSLFLRHLNILLKEYAHSGEMFATALMSWMLFSVEIHMRMAVSMILVTISVWLFNRGGYKQPTIKPCTDPTSTTTQLKSSRSV